MQGEVDADAGAQPAASQSLLGCTVAAHQQEVPLELLLAAAAKQGHKVSGGQLQQHKLLAGLTHLHLNGLQLTELHSLRLCSNLQVNLLSCIALWWAHVGLWKTPAPV